MTVKKKFPNLKKSLKNFLTDESGKITKKDALWLSAWAMLLAWIEDVVAAHSSSFPTSTNPAWADQFPTNASVFPDSSGTRSWTVITGSTCNHASGIVNWHFSSTPTVNTTSERIDFNKSHGSHNNHWNHWSWGWC